MQFQLVSGRVYAVLVRSGAMKSLVLARAPPSGWHQPFGRLPSSYSELDAVVDALAERVLDSDAPDVSADVRGPGAMGRADAPVSAAGPGSSAHGNEEISSPDGNKPWHALIHSHAAVFLGPGSHRKALHDGGTADCAAGQR
jgi:hypothetical protein